MNDLYIGLVPSFSIAVSKWCFNILVVGTWPYRINFSYVQRFALTVYMFSAIFLWINTLAVLKSGGFAIQITCSVCRSLVDWVAFVLLVNDGFVFQRQQLNSVVFSVATNILYDIQNRIILGQ